MQRFIEEIQVLEARGGPLRSQRLPDGRTTLVVRQMEGAHPGDVTVCGPRTSALFKTTPGMKRAVILQFKPGWAVPLFGVSASTLTNQFVKLPEVWGRWCAELCAELVATRNVSALLARISDAIAGHTAEAIEPASARLARRGARHLDEGDERVDSLAARLGVTARHLRRAFNENIGVGPKEYARSVRLRRAVRLASASGDWGRIAGDAGYYDQAHLIGEFRKLVGLTPGAYFERGLCD
ncbi:MAG: helix-turn-helix domain-containing protein [Myxococcaceae bacterium]